MPIQSSNLRQDVAQTATGFSTRRARLHSGVIALTLTVTSLLLGLMLLAGVVFAVVYLGGGG